MKRPGQIQKWATGILGAASLLLIVNLVLQFNRGRAAVMHAPASTTPRPKAAVLPGAKAAAANVKQKTAPGKQKIAAGKPKTADELSRYDALIESDLLKEFEDRPLPELRRNPFAFVAGPTKVSQVQNTPVAPAPAQPPAPPR